uniref:Alpha beta hydrolase n=1 Tax=Colletotrichum fructicola (strain Nara gc5) TaxID=1213859 RepID=L2FLS7_COLFN
MTSPLPPNARLVNIGTHSLALYAHGPAPSTPTSPVVLFVSGNIALELALLIERAPIPNPLIIVGHSWAGVLTHEYFALKGVSQVAGLVLVDANHETAPLVLDVNDPVLWKVAAGVDVYAAWGLEATHKLTPEEWDAFRAAGATEKHKLIAQREESEYAASFEALRRKGAGRQPILGDRPVYVVVGTRSRDWSGLYAAGVARGNGTEEERKYVRGLIETVDEKCEGLMREFLKVSRRSEIVFARESGHFVQMTQPDVVVDAVRWVLENQPAPS